MTLRAPIVLAVLVLLAACGGGGDLSPDAQQGRELVSGRGCAACHGAAGEGGLGPAFVGLAGSDVLLEDGTTVVADREYLRRSILEPQADIVEGYSVRMPTFELSDADVDALLAYIESLG